jgi:hypothetical protein
MPRMGGLIRRGGVISIFVGQGRGRRWISTGRLVFSRFETMHFFGVLLALSIVGVRIWLIFTMLLLLICRAGQALSCRDISSSCVAANGPPR